MNLKEVTYKDVIKAQKAGFCVTLIDVREKYEYEDGHLSGSINVPMDEVIDYLKQRKSPDGEQKVIYCNTGRRSKPVVYMLNKLENINAFNLMEGYKKLSEK